MDTIRDLVDRGMNFEYLDEKAQRLKGKLGDLENREDDIKKELEYAEQSHLKRRKVVENWLTNVANIKKQYQKVDKEIQETRLYSYKLRKTVDGLIVEATELIQQSGFPEGLTLKVDGSNGLALITTELVGQMFRNNMDRIRKMLMNDNISIIGIYGMGGVGKTTLAAHIHNQLQKHPGVSVFWTTVSQDFSIHKLQNDIAKKVDIDLADEDDDRIRAATLANALVRKKNFALILDDVWEDFCLNEVGIPIGVNGCKMILTTRLLDVCQKMNCESRVKVEPMSNEEAWELFVKKLGVDSELAPEVEETAKSLVKECAGLPLGINIMARSMKGVNDICEWRDTLDNLGESKLGQDHVLEKVFRVLKYSYKMLNDCKVQQCFLYCSLFPDDFKIDREMLIEYFIDEKLIGGMNSRQAMINRGHTILNKLEKACLLEAGQNKNGKGYVTMHDLVRDMAIQIASVSSGFLVEAGVRLQDIPKDAKWKENLVRVSLMCNRISNIPSTASPSCPKVLTLLLRQNFQLSSIPDCFFTYMKGVTVLDLSDTSIENLPNSISYLKSLTSLLLRGCWRLKSVPLLVNFEALRRLDFHKTGITAVPQGIETLVNLRYLNLDTRTLKIMPDGVLPRLSHLQYLVVHEFESYTSQLKGEEIATLRDLETFKGQFCDIDNLNTFVKSRGGSGPDKYLVQVVSNGLDLKSKLFKDCASAYDKAFSLRLCNISESKSGEDCLLLPRDIQLLHIKQCNDVKSLCDVASFKNATHLKKCLIDWCDGMEQLLYISSCSLTPFQRLESLCLKNLMNLRVLVGRKSDALHSAAIPTGTFSCLKEISIFDCPNLRSLFTRELLLNLQNLETLSIEFCQWMTEIVETSVDDKDQEETSTSFFILPKLKDVRLRCLPELRNFSNTKKSILSNALECIKIKDCPQLRRIPLLREEAYYPCNLQKIRVQKMWWDLLEWQQLNAKEFFQPFCQFSEEWS